MAVTKPELTNPMKAIKSPMPTVMATFSAWGTAWKIATRTPVAPSRTMMTPLIMVSPMASAHVTSWTTETARKLFMPRPAARAKGSRATTPNRMVVTPATRPVTAVSCAELRLVPVTSADPPRMRGLRTTMYAIATNATMPPRISCLIEDPREVISKNLSRPRKLRLEPRGFFIWSVFIAFMDAL